MRDKEKNKDIMVLIAEDELDPRYIMAKKIAEEGYQVITAQDGIECLEKLESEGPDILILDIMMPRLDGFGVLKVLRNQMPRHHWRPVIIVTARKDIDQFGEEFFSETDYYISKPCSVRDILKAVKFMVDLSEQNNFHFSK